MKAELRLLGPPSLMTGGCLTQLHSAKTFALLAYLALEADTPHSREKLAGLLWGESPEDRARHSLRQALYSLRRVLDDLAEECLVLQGNAVIFQPHRDFWVDTIEFMTLATADSTDLGAQRRATHLYRGLLLEGIEVFDAPAFEEWLFFRRDALKQQVMGALQALVDGLIGRGDCQDALSFARRLASMDALHERAHRSLMRIHAALGDLDAVRRQYRLCADVLAREMDVVPSDETQSLYHRLTTAVDSHLRKESHETSIVPPPQTPMQSLEGESRLITALFAELSNPVPQVLAHSATPTAIEADVEKLNRCRQAMTDAVSRYEGSLQGFIGDEMHAFFGSPPAYENAPEQAIRAALEMQKAVATLRLNLSVGINTGMAYFGPMGTPEQVEISAYGPAVNLAKRLSEVAQPGQILVGEGTYRLTRRAFDFELLPPLTFKGIAEPVSAYQALKALPRPEKTRGIEGLKAPMIGRDEEFAKLKGCLDDLMNGRGQVVSIVGVAGVGKSRLVAELRSHFQRREGWKERKDGGEGEQQSAIRSPQSAIWLEGRCLSTGESLSYGVFIDILKSYFQFDVADDKRVMAKKIVVAVKDLLPQQADEILPLFGNLLSVKFGNELDERLEFARPEQVKHQTLIALQDFFTALAGRQPLVLVFEDLHWADGLSLELIALLMEALALAPMMLVCVYRPEQVEPQASDQAEVPRSRKHNPWHIEGIAARKCPDRYMEIHLRELRPHESRRMVEELLWIENLAEGMEELILTKSEGNPFFVEEVIRSLIDNEIVYREGETWKARAEIASFVVPDTIQSVVMSRIDRLEGQARYVLQCASVIGRLFRRRLLAYTSGREGILDGHLWQLEDRDLIYEERSLPELEYSFKHVLTQEAAYQSLLGRRRQALHRKVGEGIEMLYRERIEEFYEELAYHYDQSGEVEKAMDYLLKAGEKARRAYLDNEAIRYFRRALERIGAFQPAMVEIHPHPRPLSRRGRGEGAQSAMEWRLAALGGLGEVLFQIGQIAEAETFLREAIAVGREMEAPMSRLALIYKTLDYALWSQGRYDEAIRLGEEGLALLGEQVETVEGAIMNDILAINYGSLRKMQKWRELNLRNAAFIERLPYAEPLLHVYIHIATMYAFTDKDVEEARKWLKTLERLGRKHYDLFALGWAYHWDAVVGMDIIGDLWGAVSAQQKALELFDKTGHAVSRIQALLRLAEVYLRLGNLQAVAEYAHRAHAVAEEMSTVPWGFTWSNWLMGAVFACRGRYDEAVEAFNRARESSGWGAAQSTLCLAYMRLTLGKRDEASRLFWQILVEGWNDLPNPDDCTRTANALSGLEEACDSPDEFRAFCRRLQEEQPEVNDLPIVQWYLEPTQAHDFPHTQIHDEFAGSLSSDWVWRDEFEDCSYKTGNGLEIHAANGRDLWCVNLSAPRVLRLVSGDFAAQTVVTSSQATLTPDPSPVEGEGSRTPPGSPPIEDEGNHSPSPLTPHPQSGRAGEGAESAPAIGGVLLWKHRQNFLRLDSGTRGKYEINFAGCIENKDMIIGRGRLPAERVFLRLERVGNRVTALCSMDGVAWLAVGSMEFPVEDPVEIGLHAIGNIDRTIYHGVFPDGTAIRFESFDMLRGLRAENEALREDCAKT